MDFKFNIGEFVRIRQKEKKEYSKLSFLVVERVYHEWAEGVQNHYMVRLKGGGAIDNKLTPLNEIE